MKKFTRNYMLLSLLVVGVLSFFACSSNKTLVVEDGWDLLARQKVNFVKDKDVIEITNENRYTTIKFRVEDRDVRINDLKIYFNNGDKLEPAMDDIIAADQYSRDIDIAREGRQIDKIEFKYRTTGNVLKGRANVLVLGRRTGRFGY
jgi:hypothetical protein